MENSEPSMDILDGSDVDEDNVGDVDADQENVLLESDDEEAHPHQGSKTMGRAEGRNSEEEEDVLNIVLQGDEEEILDYEGDDKEDDGVSQPMGKFRDDDEYDEDGDDDGETRTRSRFTTERNVESRNTGGGGHFPSTSSIQTIQTLGEHKLKQMQDGRPRHWNHNNGPRQGLMRPNGPRHPGGRGHRFPGMRPGPPGDMQHGRPMLNPPVVQFNEGLFTDFNQPMRHPGPRMRQQPPQGQMHHGPRIPDAGGHRHPMQHPQAGNTVRPNFPIQQRPFFPPENHMGPGPRIQPPMPPGNLVHPAQQQLSRQPQPDFNMRGPRPPRFPHNNMHPNQRPNRAPGNMNVPPNMQRPDRPPFPQRHQRPPFRPDIPHEQMGMGQRFPPVQGFPPHQPPIAGPPGFVPPHNQHPPRFMGPHAGAPPPDQYYMHPHGPPGNYNHPYPPGEPAPFPQDAHWHEGIPPAGPPLSNGSQWPPQQQLAPHLQESNYVANQAGYNNQAPMYDQGHQRPAMVHPNAIGQPAALPITAALQTAHPLEIPQITNKSIYIKPNSEIHDALTKGGFRWKDDDRRHEASGSSSGHGSSANSGGHGSSSSTSKYYDDYDHHHYYERDRDRDRERRRPSPERRREREEDDYYDDRRKSSYYDERDRRSRRKYEDDSRERRYRSDSPEKKMSRLDNSDRDKDREKERNNKESDKLLEGAKSLGLGEDYVRKLEEQRKLREKILKTKEQRRKQVKVPGDGSPDDSQKKVVQKDSIADSSAPSSSKSGTSSVTSTTGASGSGVTKKVLRIIRDKAGNIISKKVHVVVVGKPQQDTQHSATNA